MLNYALRVKAIAVLPVVRDACFHKNPKRLISPKQVETADGGPVMREIPL